MNYKNKSFISKRRAFTLIELLIVIAIIGILFIVLVSKVDFATDKAKATGVQTDFRSFQVAFDTVAKENAGFNTFGWDTGDTNGDRVRNSYDVGDTNKDGVMDAGETWTGRKQYTETWTGVYTLVKPGTSDLDADAIFALESAINKNLDPKLHITIGTDGTITMANQAQDPWKTEYHGVYLSNAANDGKDRGALIMYSNGANQEFGSEHSIANGIVTITVPGNNKIGQDDMSIVSCYTYMNGYGEVKNMTTGFSNNQTMLGGLGGNLGGGAVVTPPTPIDYEVVDGANETFTKNETTLEFRSNADFDKFVEVKVDGSVVDPSNYTVTEGSTIVTFTKAFFDSLGEGDHTIEIVSEDGSAQASFDIAKPVTINSYSWSEIQALARANLTAEEYKSQYGIKVGDYKEVNGIKYILVDLGTDNDGDGIQEAGEDYDGFVFMYGAGTLAMNDTSTDVNVLQGGYTSSTMKLYVDDGDDTNNVDLYDKLDPSLKSVLKKVTITCNSGDINADGIDDNGMSVYTHDCHLFLASAKEYGSAWKDYQYDAEGAVFDYFSATNYSVRSNFATLANVSTSCWWTRSAWSQVHSNFIMITLYGSQNQKAYSINAVVPAFVIG